MKAVICRKITGSKQINSLIFLNILILMLLYPSCASADGGGPLLLIINFSTFLIGQVWIIGIEWLLINKLAKLPPEESYLESIIINLKSTFVIGICFPILLAIVGGTGSMLPSPLNKYFLLLGTWIFDKPPYARNTLILFTSIGFVVTYFLTVYYESLLFDKRWLKKELRPAITSKKLSWICNSISYIGLIVIVLIMWNDVLIK